jgi:hypothetical protein
LYLPEHSTQGSAEEAGSAERHGVGGSPVCSMLTPGAPSALAIYGRGKGESEYTPHSDVGDGGGAARVRASYSGVPSMPLLSGALPASSALHYSQ